MCQGRVIRVWVQDEAIEAIKFEAGYAWAPNLESMIEKGWQVARPRLINRGGGKSVWLVGDQRYSFNCGFTKSIRKVLQHQGEVNFTDGTELSGWHAYRDVSAYQVLDCGGSRAYHVLLRGLLRESSRRELIASEMKVLCRA